MPPIWQKLNFTSHSPKPDYWTGLLRIKSLQLNEADENTKNLLRYGNAKRMFPTIQNLKKLQMLNEL